MGSRSGPTQAIRTTPPIYDLGFVDFVTHAVDRRETRGGAQRTVDVDHTAAAPTDQMMVVVSNPILEAGR